MICEAEGNELKHWWRHQLYRPSDNFDISFMQREEIFQTKEA